MKLSFNKHIHRRTLKFEKRYFNKYLKYLKLKIIFIFNLFALQIIHIQIIFYNFNLGYRMISKNKYKN